MNDFDYDNLQKKRIARNARAQKKGSKSRKCTLPSDYLTPAQKRKLNGEIMTYTTKKPITWKEFKFYPVEIQAEYFKHFAEEHKCNRAMMAEMFGTNMNNLNMYIARRPELNGILHSRATAETIVKFREFLAGGKETVADEPNKEEPIEEPVETPIEKTVEQPKKQLPEMPYVNTIQAGTFKATGRAMDIGQTLYRMFQDMKIRAVISFEAVDDAD